MTNAIRLCSTERDYISWDQYLYDSLGAHYFQTYGWLKSYESLGFKCHIFIHEVDGRIIGGVGILSAKLPFLPWSIVIIPHGPLPADPTASSWRLLWLELDTFCRRNKAIYAQLYPHEFTEHSVLLGEIEKLGFTEPAMFSSHRFSSTPVTIDLRGKTAEGIINSFRKNTRYYIRRALTGQLKVRTAVDPTVFDKIHALFLEHGELMGFKPRPYHSLKDAWGWFAPRGMATFIQAWYNETLVGAILLIFTGRTAYYVAGATKRDCVKDFPGELMHWHAIRQAIERQMATYDFTSVGTTGVAQFKAGFRPMYRSWHEPRTKVYRPVLAYLISFAERSLRPVMRRVMRYWAGSRS